MAYGPRELQRLCEQVVAYKALGDARLVDALQILTDCSSHQENKITIITIGIIPTLGSILSDSGTSLQSKSAVCDLLASLALLGTGRSACVESSELLVSLKSILLELSSDPELQRRVLHVIAILSDSYDGTCNALDRTEVAESVAFYLQHRRGALASAAQAAGNILKNTPHTWKLFVGQNILMPVFRQAVSAETSILTRQAIFSFLHQISLATNKSRLELLAEPAFVPICAELLNMEIETLPVVKMLNAIAIEPEGKRQLTKYCILGLSRLTLKFPGASEIIQLIRNCAEDELFVRKFTQHNLLNPELLRVTIGSQCLRVMPPLLTTQPGKALAAVEYILTHHADSCVISTAFVNPAEAARSPKIFALTQCPGLLETLEALSATACLQILKY
jgi:hypothetical protein